MPVVNYNQGRQRGLFPLSSLNDYHAGNGGGSLSRGTAQRISRKKQMLQTGNAAIDSLNWLEGFDKPSATPPFLMNKGQRQVHQHVVGCVRDLGRPPDDLRPPEAFVELRGAGLYDDPSTSPARYCFADLSLPKDGSVPLPWSSVLDKPGDRSFEADFVRKNLLQSADAAEKLRKLDLPVPHCDPTLTSSPTEYGRFIRKLVSCGVCELTTKKGIETCGCFFCQETKWDAQVSD